MEPVIPPTLTAQAVDYVPDASGEAHVVRTGPASPGSAANRASDRISNHRRTDSVRRDRKRVTIVGAGVGGLACAIDLAARGLDVTVLERAATPGGKMREVEVGGARIDAGPTVFTMRWVFEELFERAGRSFASDVRVHKAEVLARHAWSADERLDLFADPARSADEIGRLSGAAEAKRFLQFCDSARDIYTTLERPFLRGSRPNPVTLVSRAGLRGLGGLWRIRPFATMWQALGDHFQDPRLRQLFGRYSTYCGASPFQAPATLMLVAHVEQDGVWLVDGGMHRLAQVLAQTARAAGATLRYGTEVRSITTDGRGVRAVETASGERIEADAVVVNADASALGAGLFGEDLRKATPATPPAARSLSAMTWLLSARTSGFPLSRHNVFFSRDYRAEFDAIFRDRRTPDEPTVYVCAQDRDDVGNMATPGPERMLCLVNAPPTGDREAYPPERVHAVEQAAFAVLSRCGLEVDLAGGAGTCVTPAEFHRLFPATGGALYGRASHGWLASFQRPGARTRVPGLYLAGGSTHPGPGVPMAALSGGQAAQAVLIDLGVK